jgi:hypothetical protein
LRRRTIFDVKHLQRTFGCPDFRRADAARKSLSRVTACVESDLILTSPVTDANVRKGAMSVGDLTQAILRVCSLIDISICPFIHQG